MRKILLLALVFVTSVTAFGQSYSNKGKDFWISYPEHINGTNSIMGLYITSDVNTTGTISVNGSNIPFTVTANNINPRFLNSTGTGTFVIGLNTYVHLANLQDGIKTNAAIHVVSVDPVVVYAHIIFSARSGSSLILPTNVWGKEYIVPSYANSGGNAAGQGYGEINVMASLPNTVVEITPQITTRNGARAAGVPYQITLANPGDVYQVQFPQSADMSGTLVKSIASGTSSCQPIAVTSATTWTALNCGSGTGGDNLYQQLFPYGTWGKEFFTSPLKKTASATDHNVDVVRVYVKDPATTVQKTENGVITTLGGLNIGNFYEYSTEYPTNILADKPIQIMQFIKTQNCNAAGSPQTQSDPEMIALSSVEQTINDITVYSSIQSNVPGGNSAVTTHYINVIMKSANTGTFKINGATPGSAFISIPGTGYSYLKQNIPISAPVSRLTADSGFNAIAYGFGNVESYGYNAGTSVRDLNTHLEINNPNSSPTETDPSACTNSPFKFKVYFPDSSNSLTAIRYDSIKWEILNNAVNFVPNNFPVMIRPLPPAPPNMVEPDSVNIRNGKYVAWYSLPASYYVNTPGVYRVRITLYRSSSEGCGNSVEYEFDLTVTNPPTATFTATTPGCYLEPVIVTETTPQIPKTTYKQWWEFYDPVTNLTTVYSNMSSGPPIRTVSHTFTTSGVKQIRHVSITTPGCISDTIVTTVNLPDKPFATIAGNATVCINSVPSVPVTFTGTDGTAEYIFSYNINGGGTLTTPPSLGGVYTINAPTNVAGTFIYNLVGVANASPVGTPCTRVITGQTVTVNILPDHAIALGAGNPNQTVCVNNAITPFTLTLSGGATNIAAPAGLPPGVTATAVGNTVTISGTPTSAVGSPFNYTITTTGNACLTANYTGTITVNADHTISLNAGTPNQAVCINTPIAPFTLTLAGGATGITPAGLPPGVTATVVGNIVTISGTPTSTAGSPYNYNITTTGNSCLTANFTGIITVNPDHTIALAGGNPNQTVCVNNAITTFTLTLGGGATGIIPVGLPPGVTATVAGNTVTISGIPTSAIGSPFNYSLTTSGNSCLTANYTGAITVNDDATIALTSAAGTNNQAICINTSITDIDYLVAGGGTGATIAWTPGVPPGIGFTPLGGNSFRISGTASAAGTYNYTISTTGPCIKPTATGTLVVKPDHTIAFNSGSPNPTLCVNTVMPPFTLVLGGGANNILPASGLPPGVIATVAGNIVTISGTPTLQGTYPYSITTSGNSCVPATYTNTIIVIANATLVRTSAAGTDAQQLCKNSTITAITYDFGGSATGATVAGLPAGVTWSVTGNTVTIVGTPTVSSPVAYTYTVNTIGPCVTPSVTGTILVNALPTASFTYTAPSCETRNITFTDGSTANVGALDLWTWNFGDPASGPLNTSGLQNPVHVYAAAGAYTVTLTVRNNKGCISNPISTTVVNINNRPAAGFIVPDVCINDVATVFTDTSKIASGAINRPANQWNYGDPGSGPLNNSVGINGSHLYTSTGIYQVRQIVTSSLGCKDTIILPITINSADPVSNFTAGNMCSSDSVSLVNLSTVGFGNVTRLDIYWDNVGAPAVFQTILNPAFNGVYKHKYPTLQVNRTYNIRMIAYSGVICSNQKITPIAVYATPRVQFNNIPPTCYLRAPFQITQASEIGGVSGTPSYSGGPYISNTGIFDPQVAGIGTHNIKFTWTSNMGGGCIDTLTRTITVLDTAHAVFAVTLPSCEQVQTIFTNLSTVPASVTLANTVWNFGDLTGPQTFPISAPSISHIYAGPGPYTVSMHTVSNDVPVGCLSTDTSALINIDANHHMTLNAGSNTNQTVCINTPITPIIYTLSGGATGATVTGLPAGITASVTGNILTISGTPTTAVLSPYNFNIITTGNTCLTATAAGIITVKPDHAISLNGTNNNQTVCINTPIAPIVYTLSGGANGATVTGLPPGVTASVTGNTVTISGTPTTTVASPYNFNISTTGNSCVIATASGSITVEANHTIALNAGSNINQTVCINTPITAIVYTLGGGASGATVTGLPAGITASVTGNQLTISGAPTTTVGTPFNFNIITTGNVCVTANASGSVTVLPDHVLSRNSGDSAQSVCVNTPIDPIVYDLAGGATTATASGLPPGVTGVPTAGNTFTISGTPTSTAGSPYNFTIQTSGNGCVKANTIGEIKVNPYPVPDFTFDKTSYCVPNANVGFINTTTPTPLSNYTYLWDFGDGLTSTAVSPNHLYTSYQPSFTVNLKARSTVLLNGGVIGCEGVQSKFLTIVHPQPKADFVFSKPAGVCIGDNVLLTDATDNKDGLPDKYFWNLGDGTTENTYSFTHTYPDTVTYIITMYSVNSFGCNSDTINKLPLVGLPYKPFTVYPYPHVSAGPDKNVLEGGSVRLDATAYAIQPQYSWTPIEYLTDSKILQPRVVNPKTDMTYRLTVTGKGGCQFSDDVFVKLLKFPAIPNTFSPNNDGINDTWRIDYLNTYPDNRVQIFTRAGKLVFESRGYTTPWDGTLKGKPLPFDTYYYIIEPGNGRDPITGYVTILK